MSALQFDGLFIPKSGIQFYHVNHRLNIRVRHDTKIYRLVVYELGDVQVVLDVQSLEKLASLLIYENP